MRRTYFRLGPLLDMGYSGHVTLSLPVKRPQLGRIWRNFRLRMHRTFFRTLTNVTSGHVTDVTFGHVTSGHDTSGYAQWSDPPHDPPQMRLCPCPYTTYLIINTFLPRVRINYKYLFYIGLGLGLGLDHVVLSIGTPIPHRIGINPHTILLLILNQN